MVEKAETRQGKSLDEVKALLVQVDVIGLVRKFLT
jgi:hypothetical protein